MSDPYEVMGVCKDATPEQIKSAYRRLSKEFHPDRGGDPERMHELSRAYAILSDPFKRNLYDSGAGEIAENYEETLKGIFRGILEVTIRKHGPQRLKSGFDKEASQAIRDGESALKKIDADIKALEESIGRVGEGSDVGTVIVRDTFSTMLAGQREQHKHIEFQLGILRKVKEAGIEMVYRDEQGVKSGISIYNWGTTSTT